ncbi:pre-mRNA-processing factor 40 homolog B-like [Oscarella lobularis]|uniref:pre-mRNA-processing factor 40 homolog B-like n=1 Tax=Oscarella lobularis TaxID=121494 RepID=UPI00331321F3
MSSTAKSNWQEHKAPDGRKYYFNAETKESRWEKPEELLSDTEQLLKLCPWKEHKSESGKVYFFNTKTEESTWTCPKELQEIKDKIEKEKSKEDKPKSPAAATEVKKETDGGSQKKEEELKQEKDRAAVLESREQARIAFKELLKEKGIQSTASWEYAIRQISGDTRFHAVKRGNERKQLFNEYKAQAAKDERELQRQKAKQLREDLKKLFESHEKFHSEIRWRYVCDIFQDAPEFQAVPVSERRDVFEDVVFQLTRKEEAEERKQREENRSVMRTIYNGMKITYKTTWDECLRMLKENPEYTEDSSLQDMDKEDVLTAFQDYIIELEKAYEAVRAKNRSETRHQERKNREAFVDLLTELQAAAKLDSTSLWMDLYPEVNSDARYDALLGQMGSNPLELFKLYVADLKDQVHDGKKIVKQILKDADVSKDLDLSYEKLECVVAADDRTRKIERDVLDWILKGMCGIKIGREKEKEKEQVSKDQEETKDPEAKEKDESESRPGESEVKDQEKANPMDEETEVIRPEAPPPPPPPPSKGKSAKRKRRRASSESDNSDSGDERKRSPSGHGSRKKKHKKSKKKKRKNHSRDPSPSSDGRKKHKSSSHSHKEDKEAESSEDEEELERRRAQLLKQLSGGGD